MNYRRLRDEQIMERSGPACACGRRSWVREPVRDSDRRRFRCSACHTVIDVSAKLFQEAAPAERRQTA
jgi:hypothetical protein